MEVSTIKTAVVRVGRERRRSKGMMGGRCIVVCVLVGVVGKGCKGSEGVDGW